jgi:hypothetical protein
MDKKREISVGQHYYYNNGKVTILKIETDDFVLVCGDKDIHTEVNGSEFCQMCMVGGMMRHTCSDVDEVVEDVLEDISDSDIFWVNIKHLQDKPFEYKKWEKIKEENSNLSKDIAVLQEEKIIIVNNIKELEEQREKLLIEISNKKEENEEILSVIEENKSKAKTIIEDKEKVITLDNSNITMSVGRIVRYIEDSIKLEYLERGGVDNWEWYGESLPECEDPDEFMKNEALERLCK